MTNTDTIYDNKKPLTYDEFYDISQKINFVEYINKLFKKSADELDDFDIFFLKHVLQEIYDEIVENLNKIIQSIRDAASFVNSSSEIEIITKIHKVIDDILSEYNKANNELDTHILFLAVLTNDIDIKQLQELNVFEASILLYKKYKKTKNT